MTMIGLIILMQFFRKLSRSKSGIFVFETHGLQHLTL